MARASDRQSDRAYEELKDLIVTLELEPDSLISERDMMERLGVGRTPLREALQRLTSEHLVRTVPRRGYFVAGLTYLGVADIYELRQCVEGFATRLAALRATPDDQIQLKAFIQEADAGVLSDDWRWHLKMDATFHDLVAQVSHNPYVRQTVGGLYNVSVRELYVSHRPITMVRDEIGSYRAIVEAICLGDAEAAELAMREHVSVPGRGLSNE